MSELQSDNPVFPGPHHLRRSSEGRLPVSSPSASVAYAAGDDEGFIVTFREDTEYMEYLSKQAGYPIFRLRIMTNMVAPGNTKTVWDHPTTGIRYDMAVDPESGEIHTDWEVLDACENGDVPEPLRFPKAWNRFLRKTTPAQDGVPIEEWGAVTKTYAASLKAQNIHTVQALASLTDANAQNVMGAVKYRDLARAYLDERQKVRIVAVEQEKANRAEERAAELARQVTELQASVQLLTTQLQNSGQGVPHTPPGARTAGDHAAIPQQLVKREKAKRAARKIPVKDDAPIETAA